jgi:hypothetical protein
MTASLLELRRVPETCGRDAAEVRTWRGWPGSAGLSGWTVRSCPAGWPRAKFTAVATKSSLILPYLAVAAGLAVACYAIRMPRRTS